MPAPNIGRAVATALAALCVLAPAAYAHEGNPNYRSQIRAITPALPGLEARVLNYDDRIELDYEGTRPLVVEGYRGEPYLRFLPDGRVEVNRRSPAAYLNEDRFAEVEVPGQADHRARPEWQVVARNGRYDWHDHRIHWMSEASDPPQLTDSGEAHPDLRLAHSHGRGGPGGRRARVAHLDGCGRGRLPARGGAVARRCRYRRWRAGVVRAAAPQAKGEGGSLVKAAVAIALLALLAVPQAAQAHAQLVETTPQRGASLAQAAAHGRAALRRARRGELRSRARVRRRRRAGGLGAGGKPATRRRRSKRS